MLLDVVTLGVVAVPGGAGGFIIGSVIIKRLSLSVEKQLRAMFLLAVVCMLTMSMFFVQCDTAPLARLTDRSFTQHSSHDIQYDTIEEFNVDSKAEYSA